MYSFLLTGQGRKTRNLAYQEELISAMLPTSSTLTSQQQLMTIYTEWEGIEDICFFFGEYQIYFIERVENIRIFLSAQHD